MAFMDVPTYNCNTFELVSRTLQDEYNSHQVHLKMIMGVKTLLISTGVDKWIDGLTYSMLLGTREEFNNSAKRRRPIAYAAPPTAETTGNLRKLLNPIIEELWTLKDNTAILHLKVQGTHFCVGLACDYDQNKH